MLALTFLRTALAFDPALAPVAVPFGTVHVDGDLSDPAWATAPVISEFLRFQPTEGGPPPGMTEVRLLEDQAMLYVGVSVTGAVDPVRARIAPREDINDDDQNGIYLDPYGDANSGFIFYFNARGIPQDIRFEGGQAWNFAWDTVLYAEGHATDHDYTIEIGIPFRSLKYPGGGGEQTWGLMITRKIPGDDAKFGFPKLARNASQLFAQAAPMVLHPPKGGSGVELVPGLTLIQQADRPDPTAPMAWSGLDPWSDAIHPSLDVRYGLTPSIGLGATVNPDFSQVETDETPVALNERFAFSFDERRPFFLDGSGYLDDIVGTLYSRSIVSPLYAVKGYSQSDNWSIGLLHAWDRQPTGSVNLADTPGFGSAYDPSSMDGADAVTTMARASRAVGQGGHAAIVLANKDIVHDGEITGTHELAGLDVNVPLGAAWSAGVIGQASTTSDGTDRINGIDGGFGISASGDTEFLGVAYGNTPGFRRETGFQGLSGDTGGFFSLAHNFEPNGGIDLVRPAISGEASREWDGDDYGSLAVETRVQLGPHVVMLGTEATRVDQGDVHVNGGSISAEYVGEAGAVISWRAGGSVGREYAWDFGSPARSESTAVRITLRPTPRLRSDLSWEGEWLAPTPAIGAGESSQRVRSRVGVQFTRVIGVRWIEEFVSFAGPDDALPSELTSSMLVTALKQPGTALYVGFADRIDLAARQSTDRTVFLKATLLQRP